MVDFIMFITQNWGLVGLLFAFPVVTLIILSTVLLRVIGDLNSDIELLVRTMVSVADKVANISATTLTLLRMMVDVVSGINVLVSQDENNTKLTRRIQDVMQRHLNGLLKERGD